MKLFLLLVVSVAGLQTPSIRPPNGYRFPTDSDYTGGWQRPRGSEPPVHIRADFNGDRLFDDAWILLGRTGPQWGLFVFLGTTREPAVPIALDTNAGDTPPQSMGIRVVKPGRYDTACGKGYWPCAADEPPRLVLKNPGIDYSYSESANAFFWWDERTRLFRRTWISD